jgi:RNA polymerase II elongation factor ELL
MAVSVASHQGQAQQRLGLSNAKDAHNKHIVLVKLTDSSLEALTNYIKHANKSNSASASFKPTIQFSHNTGTFTVPIIGEEGHKDQKFNFSLSSNQENGPQASFECLESRKPASLESLGPVQHKAQVQASERSFEKFRNVMGDVKREQEKRTTRILDKSKIGVAPNCAGGLVGSKQIVSRKHILANKSLQSSGRSNDLNKYSHSHGHGSRVGIKPNPASAVQSANHHSVSSASQNVSAVSAGPSQSQQNQQHSQQAIMPNHMPGMPTGMSMGVSAASNNHGLSSHTLNGCHPMLDRNKHKNKPNNPEIMKRTLRERIVHLLAVRPLKKPELLARMIGDGLREKEKKELFPVVKQVSIMKDNTYQLQRHIWNDVSEDWPFYTDEERQAFRRRKPQNLTPPGSDGSTGSVASGHSSSSSHPASPQPSLKRSSAYLSSGDASPLSDHLAPPSSSPAAKKKRVSNFVRPSNSLSPMSSLGRSPNNRSPSAPVLPPAVPGEPSGESKTNAWLKTNQEELGRFSPSNSKSNDFTTKFVRIGNSEQRRVYKAEFNKDYNRYMVLHAQLDRVSQRFANLQRQLRHTSEASPDHQRLKKMVVKEYQAANDNQVKRDREEFQYLHKKLDHIKKLVHDYDTKYANQPRQPGNHRSSSSSGLNSNKSPVANANLAVFPTSS